MAKNISKEQENIIKNSVMKFDSRVSVIEFKKFCKASEDLEEDAKKDKTSECINFSIDMLRTGKFIRKSMFGDYLLTIDESLMDTMIENFNNNVIGTKVALDTNHSKSEAYGWLTSLSKDKRDIKGKPQVCLVGNWSINIKGQDIVKNEVYKYFSIEFMYNYSQREVFDTTKTPDGQEIPKGEVVNYGPTITGGALTNRPFIPDLNEIPMMFTNEDIISSGYLIEMKDDLDKSSGVSLPPVLNSVQSESENITKSKTTGFNISGFSKHKEKENMKFSASASLLKFMEEKLSTIEDKNAQEYKDLLENIESAKQEFATAQTEMDTRETAVKDLVAANKKMTDQFSELTTKVVSLESKVQTSESELMLQRERARQSEISEYCTGLATKGMTKPFIDKVKEILLADRDNKEIVMLSDDKGAKTGLTVRDVIKHIVDALPSDVKISTTPSLEFDVGSLNDSETKNESDKFSEEFADAIAAGTKKGLAHLNKKSTKKIISDSDKDMN